jgi:hypothetical protein
MSDEDRKPIGSGNGGGVPRRVGNAERDEAIAMLDEHWHAGRPPRKELSAATLTSTQVSLSR